MHSLLQRFPEHRFGKYSLGITLILFGLALLGNSSPAFARAYRCTDANGNISYSQSSCMAGKTGERVHGISTGTTTDREVCGYVRRFASESFDKLKKGMEPSVLIDQYGGPGYISNVTLNVINFVSGFRYNKNVSAQKVGAIAYSKCSNRGFGNLQVSELPPEIRPTEDPVPETSDGTSSPSRFAPGPVTQTQQAAREDNRQRQCLNYEQQLENLNRSMRQGYGAGAGQKMRQQRQQYEALLRKNCRR